MKEILDFFNTFKIAIYNKYLIAAPKCSDNTIGAEAMQTLLRGHSFFEHIEAYWAHEFTMQAPGTNRDLCIIRNCILRCPMKFIK